jgi:signal transduction histidine kinase
MPSVEKILIIDDDRTLRLSLRTFLEGLGHRVLEAASGQEGLAMALEHRPALILLDITMPGMNGFETCAGLLAIPGNELTPVMVMSGLLGTSNMLKAFKAGAVDCLAKPLAYAELEARLKAHLALRRQTLALREGADTLRKALVDAGAMNRNLIALNEKLRRSEEVKTRFLALMRNEINNPLNDIMGLAGRIADPAVPADKARSLAAMVKEEAFRLDCQMQNVFTAAELEAGEASPSIARVDVASILRDLETSFAPAAAAKGVTLLCRVEGAPEPFPTDGDKVHHLLANLVANAVECCGPGGRVEVLAEAGPETLALQVSDQGPGFGAADLKTLFEPFQAQGDRFPALRGHGLGLPVVKALVDLLEGNLRVDAAPGEGSRFRVTLPRAQALHGVEGDVLDGNILFFDEPREF